ncbi:MULTISPECIES: PAS domain-containing methyl-accepting chemotaxis protein [unclassified Thioalkalivibrio]|uniref:methyl-accepting chemotaxis protein n=1 Tax=unclassified Thioalkalivibrio TaxID=2621013 RepID=UPI00037DA8D1|nr:MULTISPECIES: PAS domain-containing methyl-accepting chemotaxis protein [unclassified Thioalkalivibrio]PYG03933.1 methyl-accepting chemotaxis sensory transducer with Pas/Pac sensor [Thioalkalivibrio sp. ALE21]
MKKNLPVTQREVDYPESANILSTTNLKGAITYVNPDFLRISGFEHEELIGKNHNVIRHPDMPPAAFADLWNTIKSGRSWMGMVKNRCKNGDHYWVSAYVTPVMRDGQVVEYQSVRTKPRREHVEAAERVYADLMQERTPLALRLPRMGIKTRALASIAGGLAAGLGVAAAFTGLTAPSAAVIAASGLVVGGGLAWNGLSPLCNAVARARRLTGNPISQYIYTGRMDEAGELEFAMRMLEAEAGAVVGRMGDAAEQLGETAEGLTAAVNESRSACDRQQQETEEVASATNQMVNSVQDVARSAQSTADAADQTDSEAREGQEIVQKSTRSIETLGEEVARGAAVMSELGEESEKISSVLDVIRGIAEQTNLLALNAAIEAARAGEQGRGFAVVADEVRTLASRTQNSTSEIQAMIERLQDRARAASEVMNQSHEQARASVDQARRAAESLTHITEGIARIRDMSNQIAAAVEEQGTAGGEINRGVETIRSAADTTATRAGDSHGAARSVSELAAGLQNLSRQFWEQRRQG